MQANMWTSKLANKQTSEQAIKRASKRCIEWLASKMPAQKILSNFLPIPRRQHLCDLTDTDYVKALSLLSFSWSPCLSRTTAIINTYYISISVDFYPGDSHPFAGFAIPPSSSLSSVSSTHRSISSTDGSNIPPIYSIAIFWPCRLGGLLSCLAICCF